MTDQGSIEASALGESEEKPADEPYVVTLQLPHRWFISLAGATIVVVAVVFGSMWAFTRSRTLMVTILISVFLAFAMLPAVDRLSRRGWRRGSATGVVMIGSTLAFLVFSVSIFNVFVEQIRELIERTPDYAESTVTFLNDRFGIEVDASTVAEDASSADEFVKDNFSSIVGGTFGVASTVLGGLFRAMTVLLFLFYILADAPRWRAAMFSRMSPDQQVEADRILTITIDKVGGYVYSRGFLAVVSAGFHFVAFFLLDLPFAFALALWVGVISQFIPTIGLYVAAVVPLLVAVLEDPILAVWIVVIIVIYQQFENYVLSPRITANTMQLHPAVAFGAALLGGNLLGAVGAVLALPVAATAKALIETYTEAHEIVKSDTFEGLESYEARMAARREAKKGRFRRFGSKS